MSSLIKQRWGCNQEIIVRHINIQNITKTIISLKQGRLTCAAIFHLYSEIASEIIPMPCLSSPKAVFTYLFMVIAYVIFFLISPRCSRSRDVSDVTSGEETGSRDWSRPSEKTALSRCVSLSLFFCILSLSPLTPSKMSKEHIVVFAPGIEYAWWQQVFHSSKVTAEILQSLCVPPGAVGATR